MKKLGLLIVLLLTISMHALGQDKLENAIRSFDLKAVERLLKEEKLNEGKYWRYLTLVDGVVGERKFWLTEFKRWENGQWRGGTYLHPSYVEDPDLQNEFEITEAVAALKGFGGAYLGGLSIGGLVFIANERTETFSFGFKGLLVAGALASATLLVKAIRDFKKYFAAKETHKKKLQQQYDDAVAIKQLIYAAQKAC